MVSIPKEQLEKISELLTGEEIGKQIIEKWLLSIDELLILKKEDILFARDMMRFAANYRLAKAKTEHPEWFDDNGKLKFE